MSEVMRKVLATTGKVALSVDILMAEIDVRERMTKQFFQKLFRILKELLYMPVSGFLVTVNLRQMTV